MSLKEERAERGVRARQKAATRERLLAAARRCFERGGYRGTVVADIVREAGVAHGTFYVHFTGVEGVADALLESFNEGLARRLGPVLAAGGVVEGGAGGGRGGGGGGGGGGAPGGHPPGGGGALPGGPR